MKVNNLEKCDILKNAKIFYFGQSVWCFLKSARSAYYQLLLNLI